MKMDINSDVHGTYSKGQDRKGEYGDGDRVYVQDSNDYCGSYVPETKSKRTDQENTIQHSIFVIIASLTMILDLFLLSCEFITLLTVHRRPIKILTDDIKCQ